MDIIKVTKASVNDLVIVQKIGEETFLETFADSNTVEDMNKYLENNFNYTKVTAELTNPESSFYIAWENEIPLGYLKVNAGHAQTEHHDEKALEIERIYVKSSHHGKNIGQILYDKALELAKNLKSSYLWLGVWEKNPRAIRFYEKNGFSPFDTHIFRMGNDEQLDILMKKQLQ